MLRTAYPQNLIFKMPLSDEYDYSTVPSSDKIKKNKEHEQSALIIN